MLIKLSSFKTNSKRKRGPSKVSSQINVFITNVLLFSVCAQVLE